MSDFILSSLLFSSVPGGVRLGAPALTSRGFNEEDFVKVVDFIDEAVSIAKDVQSKSKKLKDFKQVLESDESIKSQCEKLKSKVAEFARKYPMPGHEDH